MVRSRRRTFTAAEIQLAQTLVRQSADVIENSRLFTALEDEKRRLELLYNLSQSLTASLDLGKVSRRALDLVCDALRPFRLRMILAGVGEDAALPVLGRRELETRAVPQRPSVHGEMMIRSSVAVGLPVEVSVFDVDPNAEPHRAVGGEFRL